MSITPNANRIKKQETVTQIRDALSAVNLVVLTHYKGLTVEQITQLRRKAKKAGAGIKVAKNSLAKIAIGETPFKNLESLLTGPTAISYSEDSVAAAKLMVEFSKENEKLVILGGALGDKLLSVAEVKALAELPSLDQIRAKLVGLLQAPATKLAAVLQAPARQMVGVTAAYGAKEE